ncbi:MAG: right-handed parallel beta-helix repeat-containing protein [Deltaproteobacteria bacterium]|nr:right-handed parallel beta-helix repeat-containing protein [Deltaproteobacteria bacterium]
MAAIDRCPACGPSTVSFLALGATVLAAACHRDVPHGCAGGKVMVAGGCRTVCNGPGDCAAGELCAAGICQTCDAASCGAPIIEAIDGTGTGDDAVGHTVHHLRDRLTIRGRFLDGATAALIGPNGPTSLASCGGSGDAELVVQLPSLVASGTYTLQVSNEMGTCGAELQLLQGEPGVGLAEVLAGCADGQVPKLQADVWACGDDDVSAAGSVSWIDVTGSGAVADDATDNTAAFNAAIVAASTAGGGTVYIPPGTYRVAAPVDLLSKVHVRGAGDGTVIRNVATGTGSGYYAFRALSREGAVLSDLRLTTDRSTAFQGGALIGGGTRNRFERLHVDSTSYHALAVANGATDFVLADNYVTGTDWDENDIGVAIMVIAGNDKTTRGQVRGNLVEDQLAPGIMIDAGSIQTSSLPATMVGVSGNIVRNTGDYCIAVSGAHQVQVVGNHLERCGAQHPAREAAAIAVIQDNGDNPVPGPTYSVTHGSLIANNSISAPQTTGVHVEAATDLAIVGNVILSPGQHASGGYGIRIQSGGVNGGGNPSASGVLVAGNVIDNVVDAAAALLGTMPAGIFVAAGQLRVAVQGNMISGHRDVPADIRSTDALLHLPVGGSTFAQLGTPANGSLVYCSDCARTSPCTAGGGGAMAARLNGAWECD